MVCLAESVPCEPEICRVQGTLVCKCSNFTVKLDHGLFWCLYMELFSFEGWILSKGVAVPSLTVTPLDK